MKFFEELKRRKVFKAALAYFVFSWLLLQIVAIVFPMLQIPMGVQRWVLIALLIGFPAYLIFAYIYDWTPGGFKKTSEYQPKAEEARTTNKRSTQYIIFGLSLALLLMIADKVFNLTENMGTEKAKISTIAVLPFSHQSDDKEDTFFTSGIHEDLMTKLAGVKDFRIISKASVMPYADYEGDLKEVGKTLNAEYILQGAVRRWQNQVRLTVQLIESKSNQAIWSHEYDGKLDNVFDLQAEIATVLTHKLEANLSQDERNGIKEIPTQVLGAYDDYLKARHILNKPRSTYDDVNQSIALLDQAVAADAQFAEAWSLLVRAQSILYTKAIRVAGKEQEADRAKQKAKFALNKAKQLAPNQWEILRDEGIYYKNIEGDQVAALASFEKALEQNPSDVDTMRELVFIYFFLKDIDKSIEMLEKAFALAQTNGFLSYSLTFAYEFKGEYEKMVPLLERLQELYPEEKHYGVEAKYYTFLQDGSMESFRDFQESVKKSNAQNPWDERALKNMDMIVAMFNDEFDSFHEDWKGKHDSHIKDHGDWMCPMVTNDFINQARLLFEHEDGEEAKALLAQADEVVLKPMNPNSVCMFNPEVYIPKLDFLKGEVAVAEDKLEEITLPVLQNDLFPIGAVERSVLLEAVDMIHPDKVYYYYEQIVKNSLSMTSFESICADPWTYPNLLKDERFIAEVRADGRFVEFLGNYGFL